MLALVLVHRMMQAGGGRRQHQGGEEEGKGGHVEGGRLIHYHGTNRFYRILLLGFRSGMNQRIISADR